MAWRSCLLILLLPSPTRGGTCVLPTIFICISRLHTRTVIFILGVSVKPGLWTGLDYGTVIYSWGLCKTWTMDWTDKTALCIHQGYNSLSPALPQVASLLLSPRGIVFSISERSKVTCIFNKLQQRWQWLTFFEIVLSIHVLYLLFLIDATCICWESTSSIFD